MKLINERTGFEVAVIGMAGSFPGAANLEEFWQNLISGRESISHFSKEELVEAGVSPELLKHPQFVAAKGVFPDAEYFDFEFFGYTPADAALMDPQVRLLHQGVYHALEDAGYALGGNRNIGLFAGASGNFNWELDSFLQTAQSSANQFATLQLNDKDFIATRIAYKLDLRGPAVALHSACSTSLLAIDLACRHIYTGSCNMAVAAGVGLTLPLKNGYGYEEGMIKSADGSCRAFSEDANGTVEGNGMAAVVLKSLEDALTDGDSIYAIIRGTSANNDGERKVGFTAPSVEGQAEVIRRALYMAEVEADSVTYVEAHGTGTNLGDPVEVEALKKAFRLEKTGQCGLGSLKSNIGHTDVAAGISSFIKTALALHHRLIPASINISQANSKIGLERSPFYLVTANQPWQRLSSSEDSSMALPLRAGVSSFGIGGTNVHVILEEAAEQLAGEEDGSWQCLTLSAHNSEALTRIKNQLLTWLELNPTVNGADLAYTWQQSRSRLSTRQSVAFNSVAGLRQALQDPTQDADLIATKALRQARCVFLFPGQGTQYVGMAGQLYRDMPLFAAHLETCLEICDRYGSGEIRKILLSPDDSADSLLQQTAFTQLSLFVVEYALAKVLMDFGLKPIASLGHSLGEYVAACISGVFSLEDGIKLVQQRAKLMQSMDKGKMLAISAEVDAIKDKLPPLLDIAAINSGKHCTVAGPESEIVSFQQQLEAEGIQAKILHTSHAFHSAMMEPMLDSFGAVLKGCNLSPPQLPYYSNVSGNLITADEATSSDYYLRHIRQPVNFAEAAKELAREVETIFIEVGPGTVLSNLLKQSATTPLPTCSMLRHAQQSDSDFQYFQNAIGQLWSHGLAIDWLKLHDGKPRQKLRLPLYPFAKKPVATGRGDVLRLLTQLNESQVSASAPVYRGNDILHCYAWRHALTVDPEIDDSVKTCLSLEFDGSEIAGVLARIGGLRVTRVTHDANYQEVDSRHIKLPLDSTLALRKLLVKLRERDEVPETLLLGVNLARLSELSLLQTRVGNLAGLCNQEFGKKTLSIYIVIQNNQTLVDAMRERLALWLQQMQSGFQRFRFHIVELKSITKQDPAGALATKLGRLLLGSMESNAYIDLTGGSVKYLSLLPVPHSGAKNIKPSRRNYALVAPEWVQLRDLAASIESISGSSVTTVNLPVNSTSKPAIKCDFNQLQGPLISAQESFFHKYGIGDLTSAHRNVDEYCFSLLCDFLRHHSALAKGDRFSRDSLIAELGVIESLQRYVDYFCHLLVQEGFANREDDSFVLIKSLDSVEDPEVLLYRIQSQTRLFDGQLRLLRHAFSKYPMALSGEMQSIEVLYPDGSNQLIRDSYQDSIQQLEDELILSMFNTLVEKLVEGAEHIRILEVGGGYGMAMRRIAPLLAQMKSVEFYFTDIGSTFLAEAKNYAMEQGYDFMHFGVFDITRCAEEQGFDENSFDLIYAYNVVHATKSIAQVAGNLEKLLVDQGYLCLLERTNTRRYVDLVWGMADGWWHFDNDERELSPLMPLRKWQDLFDSLAFSETVCYPKDELLRKRLDMGIIIARAGKRSSNNVARFPAPGSDAKHFDRVFVLDTLLKSRVGDWVSLSNAVPEQKRYQSYANAVMAWARRNHSKHYCILSNGEQAPGEINNGRHTVMDQLQQQIGESAARVVLPLHAEKAEKPYTARISLDAQYMSHLTSALDSAWTTVVMSPDQLDLMPVSAESSEKKEGVKHSGSASDSRQEILTLLIIILRQLFGIDEISAEDDFFVLGGDSLKVAQFTTELEKYGFEVQPNEVFNFPKISNLAAYLDKKRGNVGHDITTCEQLANYLSGKLGIQVAAGIIEVDGTERKLLYLEDESLLNDREVKRLLSEVQALALNSGIQPDYIFPLSLRPQHQQALSNKQFSDHFRLKRVTDAESRELLRHAQLQQRRLCFSIISEPVEYQYAISPFQNMYLKTDNRVSLYQIEFEEAVDRDLLSTAFTDVVRRQGLLRSSLQRHRLEKHHWRQHQLPSRLSVPCIDISAYAEKDQETILEELMAAEYKSNFDAENGIMYHLLLVRLRFNKSILMFNLDHSIFDNMSGQVLRRQLIDRYKALKSGATASMPTIKSFKDYLDQINLGPIGVSPDELIKFFDLRRYAEARNKVEKYIITNRRPQISQLRYRVDLSSLGIAENEEAAFETAIQLLGYSLSRFLDVESVPMKLIYQGRKYHDLSFFDTLGLFVDIVPLLLDVRRAPQEMIEDVRRKLGYLNRYNLSFMNMVLSFSMLLRWRDVVGLTSPKKLAKKDPMLLLNYAGRAGREYRKIIDFATNKMLKTPGKLDYASFYVIATSEDNQLVLDILCNFESNMNKYKAILDAVLPRLQVSSWAQEADDTKQLNQATVAMRTPN